MTPICKRPKCSEHVQDKRAPSGFCSWKCQSLFAKGKAMREDNKGGTLDPHIHDVLTQNGFRLPKKNRQRFGNVPSRWTASNGASIRFGDSYARTEDAKVDFTKRIHVITVRAFQNEGDRIREQEIGTYTYDPTNRVGVDWNLDLAIKQALSAPTKESLEEEKTNRTNPTKVEIQALNEMRAFAETIVQRAENDLSAWRSTFASQGKGGAEAANILLRDGELQHAKRIIHAVDERLAGRLTPSESPAWFAVPEKNRDATFGVNWEFESNQRSLYGQLKA